jgi:ABC-type bacteriocin/lantibiotic exporter with double-glycine peptidase domain
MIPKKTQSNTLAVPYKKQPAEYYCGPTSLQMIMAFFGVKRSAEELATLADTNEAIGTWHRNMANAARASGFWVYQSRRGTIESLRSFLNKGYPVIVHLFMPEWPAGKWGQWDRFHYVVITGLTRFTVRINDPWLGPLEMPRKEFVSRWTSEVTEDDNWMLVLSPKPFGMADATPPFSES